MSAFADTGELDGRPAAFLDTYSFAADSVPPGRGTLDANQNSDAYIISPAKLDFIGKPALRPRVHLVEK
jgi:hypothetical protein